MDKPISMQINDAKNILVETINNLQLHPMILEPIIKEIYEQLHISAIQLAEQERNEYEKSLDKEDKNEEK